MSSDESAQFWAADSFCPQNEPQSAQRFLQSFRDGANAEQLNILHGVLKRDYQTLRSADEAIERLTRLKGAVALQGATPAIALRIKRILTSLSEVGG